MEEVNTLSVPLTGWHRGSWNTKLRQFCRLTGMLGLDNPNPSPTELQGIFRQVASAKVFGESVQPFLDATGKDMKEVMKELEEIEDLLGLLEPLPFMSTEKGVVDPREFRGVAILPPGIASWGATLRPDQIAQARRAGAQFERVIMLWSSRKCNAPADRRHPMIRDLQEGEEPIEKRLQLEAIAGRSDLGVCEVAELPYATDDGRPLSYQAQLEYLVESGQFEQLAGDLPIYVPSTQNSLYVVPHTGRVLGRKEIYTSQSGAHPVRVMPPGYHQSLQEVSTMPNGIIRLLVELKLADCITEDAHLTRARRSK